MTVVDTKVGQQVLLKGTDAVGTAAILAGCTHYFGYPITPQNEIGEFMARELPKVGGVFLQSESEVSAINMVFGAAICGKRAMTSTSGPGYSLMLEGISNVAGTDTPCVLVLVSRIGPGGGNIEPSQGDYTSVTQGGAHGGYHTIVLAPSSIQELFDQVQLGFDLADKYRIMVIILTEGTLAQMMEPVEVKRVSIGEQLPPKDWALTGKLGRGHQNIVASVWLAPGAANAYHEQLQQKYRAIAENEVRCERYLMEDAEVAVAAFGGIARLAWAAVDAARAEGIKAGLIRPISLWPFPHAVITQVMAQVRSLLVVEANMGQMLHDVLYATPLERRRDVHLLGRPDCNISPLEILDLIRQLAQGG